LIVTITDFINRLTIILHSQLFVVIKMNFDYYFIKFIHLSYSDLFNHCYFIWLVLLYFILFNFQLNYLQSYLTFKFIKFDLKSILKPNFNLYRCFQYHIIMLHCLKNHLLLHLRFNFQHLLILNPH
jgi:hypothetical protein